MTSQVKKDSPISFIEKLKKQWMDTVDAIKDPLMIIDKNYCIVKANKALANLAELDVKEIIGKKSHNIFNQNYSPCNSCKVTEMIDNKNYDSYELSHHKKKKYYEVTSQEILDDNGNISGILQIFRDRTEAKKLSEKLLQSQKMASIGVLAGGIAHEINNPLGGILIFSQMILREMDKKNQHYSDVVEIEAATQRCKKIVENLLEFARRQPIKTSKEELKPIEVSEAIETALQFSKVNLRKHKGLKIKKSFSKENLTIMANRAKLVQLILNLIQNASHAMPGGGNLTLKTYGTSNSKHKDCVVIEVSDTGIGIEKDELKNIFDPFYTQKPPGEGTGLGLSICHGIAEEIGAKFEVESRLNMGSSFKLVAPQVKSSKMSA